jgi:hypothetical protein
VSDTPHSDSTPPPASPSSPEPVAIATVSTVPTASAALTADREIGAVGESPTGGPDPEAFAKKKRLRHRGGRGRSKKFPAGEAGADNDNGEEDIEEESSEEESVREHPAAGGESSAGDVVAAPPGELAPTPIVRREPREPRRDSRDQRPSDRPPRPDPRPPRHERPDPRGHQRPERFERPERMDRSPLDTRELSEKAWQLFFGELREEGLALIDETDAEKLSNRCFKLAEIFMRQRQRRINQLASTGTTMHEERRPAPVEPRPPLPPRPKPEVPIEQRLPDDPTKLSKEEAEALIEEAREVAEQKAEAATVEASGAVDSGTPDSGESTDAVEVEAAAEPPAAAPESMGGAS